MHSLKHVLNDGYSKDRLPKIQAEFHVKILADQPTDPILENLSRDRNSPLSGPFMSENDTNDANMSKKNQGDGASDLVEAEPKASGVSWQDAWRMSKEPLVCANVS
jgi:hypothetical protein